jgi:hypothetical protein
MPYFTPEHACMALGAFVILSFVSLALKGR